MSMAEVLEANLALIPAAPLVGAVAAYVVGQRQRDAAGWIASAASLCAFLWVLVQVFSLSPNVVLEQNLFTWFAIGELYVPFVFRFDQLTAVMSLVVTGIGTLIHLYSIAYMHEEPARHRFFAYLNLFMFSMLLLVLGGNLLVLFVGWEGVGLCSYLLIGFWYRNLAYAGAGRKAFVVNRIGDAAFLIGIFLLFQHFGTLDFASLRTAIEGNAALIGICTAVALCLFVGATGKSAQIPLFVWLPDAMAGPTPVSALIHAATMVTAGVYLIARMFFLFDLAPLASAVVAVVAILTAFVAATTALTQNDIKKVLAYSTVSQLGFMFMAAAAGAYWVAIFHVVTHAFFKACLFLGAGSVIHGCHHEQDMRHMGGLRRLMPVTFWTYLISTLAIAGIFPFAGYQSKHAILAALQGMQSPYLVGVVELLPMLASLTALITAFYMTRSVMLTFAGQYRGHAHPHESPVLMTMPLVVLALLATVGGLWLVESLPTYLAAAIPVHHEHHPESIVAALLHSWVGMAGVALGWLLYGPLAGLPGRIARAAAPLTLLFDRKWFFDELYGALVVRPLERLGRVLWKVVDQGVIDGLVNGSAAFIDVNGEVMRGTQTGQVRHYALFMFVATLVLLLLVFVL